MAAPAFERLEQRVRQLLDEVVDLRQRVAGLSAENAALHGRVDEALARLDAVLEQIDAEA